MILTSWKIYFFSIELAKTIMVHQLWCLLNSERQKPLIYVFFFTDHSSDYITVFCASAASAIALAIFVGLFVLYRHHANKQQLQLKEESKLNSYGGTKPKMSTEDDPFLTGPIKTPPPDYMMEGYNRQRAGTMPLKMCQNGTIVRTFSAKDVHTKELNGER